MTHVRGTLPARRFVHAALLVAAVLVSLVSNLAHGRDWFVYGMATELGDGSRSRPYKTIREGIRNASPGDTVFVRAFRGFYDEWLTFPSPLNGGDANAQLRVVGIDGTPVIKPSAARKAGFVLLFANSRARNIRFDNFVFDAAHTVPRASGEPGRCIEIQSGARDISINNSWVVNARGHGIFCSERHDDDGIAENCTFHNLRVMYNGLYGIYIKADHCTVSGCTIAYNNRYGLHLWGSVPLGHTPDDCVITGNRILFNSRETSNNFRSGILLQYGKRNRIFNNIITDEANGIRISNDSGTWVVHNTIVNCRGRGIYIPGALGEESRVAQNICFRNGSNSDEDNYDVIADFGPLYERGLNWVSKDPMFVAGILGSEHRLSSKSPCRDALDRSGNRLVSYVAFDIDGLQRDDAPDFGADEYGQIRQKIRGAMLNDGP